MRVGNRSHPARLSHALPPLFPYSSSRPGSKLYPGVTDAFSVITNSTHGYCMLVNNNGWHD